MPPRLGDKPRPAAPIDSAAACSAPVDAAERKKQAARVLRRLEADHADAECALRHESPVQLLVATILSAQCTDERVNVVTAKLFADCPTAEAIAALPVARLEKYVQSAGFFRNKAKNVKACCQALINEHGGEVPQDLDALVALPGVGRKTANVVLGVAFGMATGVVVDTHVGRLSRRLGLTTQEDPGKVERDLIALLPKRAWIDFSHRMIFHGRRVCEARKPKCDACSMAKFCPRVGVPS
ncbi:MAG: endonuclease III [Lacipirellulaceae bacterium]